MSEAFEFFVQDAQHNRNLDVFALWVSFLREPFKSLIILFFYDNSHALAHRVSLSLRIVTGVGRVVGRLAL